jgi:ADP-heptose:LPS heptosyltransferase
MDFRYAQEPMYRQWLECLAQGGFSRDAGFNIHLPQNALDGSGITEADRGSYIHLSPNCSGESGQLPAAQIVELLEALHRRLPRYRIVLSAMETERERARMAVILGGLSFRPWLVHQGTLDVIQLSAVVGAAALHLSGDTGPLHLAWMLDTPSVSWFRVKFDNLEYLPPPPRHRSVLSRTEDAELTGIATAELVEAAAGLLGAQPAPP